MALAVGGCQRSDQRILNLANNVMKDHANEGIYETGESFLEL